MTGGAGFIGAYVSHALLDLGIEVVGLDNLNSYYDPQLKKDRIKFLRLRSAYDFIESDLVNSNVLADLPGEVDVVIHLAAQAGVRYSLDAPFSYLDSNLRGHLTILEYVRHSSNRPFLIYASSSSVYGDDTEPPFSEDARADNPVSLYAATKRGCELLSESYSALYGMHQVGLRFFTVYGAWGRPDMAYFKFAEAMMDGREIQVFNKGNLMRDFTWIDDIVDGVVRIALGGPEGGNALGRIHRVYNIGNNKPERLLDFIEVLEASMGIEARKTMVGMQPGDVHVTAANIDAIQRDYGFEPTTSIGEGLLRFSTWFKSWRAGEECKWGAE